MKYIPLKIFLLLLFFVGGAVNSALYKGVDAEGNVVYSDTPFENAERFTPPKISVVEKEKVKLEVDGKVELEEKPVEFKYLDFDIVSPKTNDTIRDQSDVAVTLKLRPGLNLGKGHSIWLLVNGKPLIKNSLDMSLRIERLERGAQEIQAQVRDEQGKIIVRTRTAVVFIHPPSAR